MCLLCINKWPSKPYKTKQLDYCSKPKQHDTHVSNNAIERLALKLQCQTMIAVDTIIRAVKCVPRRVIKLRSTIGCLLQRFIDASKSASTANLPLDFLLSIACCSTCALFCCASFPRHLTFNRHSCRLQLSSNGHQNNPLLVLAIFLFMACKNSSESEED